MTRRFDAHEDAPPLWRSPLALAIAGTIAIHVIVAVIGDAIVVLHPHRDPPPPPPTLELVDIEPAPELAPPPPPIVPAAQPPPAPPPPPPVAPPPQLRHNAPTPTPTPTETPAASQPAPPTVEPLRGTEGGDPVVSMPDVAPAATGVAVAVGAPGTGHIGRGGRGGGTGAGTGSGTAEVVAAPISIAAIKTRALPRGDYAYFDAGKDYPAEAKSLGVEGVIRVRLIVDAGGKVTQTKLLNRLGHGLDELALKRAGSNSIARSRRSSCGRST